MEPENNIEMIIRGYLNSGHTYPLVVVGNMSNKFGKYIFEKYSHILYKIHGATFDQRVLNNLRISLQNTFMGILWRTNPIIAGSDGLRMYYRCAQ
ncbi:MAG: hypothetical protein WDN26_04035 [Chitinophagaceae bacterium]